MQHLLSMGKVVIGGGVMVITGCMLQDYGFGLVGAIYSHSIIGGMSAFSLFWVGRSSPLLSS